MLRKLRASIRDRLLGKVSLPRTRFFAGSKLEARWHYRRNLRGVFGCPPPGGECEISPLQSAKKLFDLWNLVCLRRMGSNHWDLVPSPLHPGNGDPNLRVFRAVAFGNPDRSRRRWSRTTISPISRWLVEPRYKFHRAIKWRPVFPNGHFPYVPFRFRGLLAGLGKASRWQSNGDPCPNAKTN